jgi:hypothetical protein
MNNIVKTNVQGMYLSQADFEQLALNEKMKMAERFGVTLEEYDDALLNGKVLTPKTPKPKAQQMKLWD